MYRTWTSCFLGACGVLVLGCGGDIQTRDELPDDPQTISTPAPYSSEPDAGLPTDDPSPPPPPPPPQQPDAGPPPDSGTPPTGCNIDEHFFNGYCYSAVGMKWITYEVGRQICLGRGAEVASINSEAENQFIFGLLPMLNSGAWIGLLRKGSTDTFEWQDGTPTTFVNWAPPEPNNENGQENCTVMWGPGLKSFPEWQGQWNDEPCDGDLDTIICKRKP